MWQAEGEYEPARAVIHVPMSQPSLRQPPWRADSWGRFQSDMTRRLEMSE